MAQLIKDDSSFQDWRWQIKNSVKTVDQLKQKLPVHPDMDLWLTNNFQSGFLPFSATPYLVSLMSGAPTCPIFMQMIASAKERLDTEIERIDPLGEEERKRAPHLVHRYPDRVLFLATDRCAAYCRFCTRKRWVGQGPTPLKEQHEEAFNYIENYPVIKEIIFSGGDPLVLTNDRILYLLERAFSIKHIDVVRFHSRMLSFAPMRIDEDLCKIFGQFSPIYFVTHFNHPKEITESAIKSCRMLVQSGVVLLNQSVLLKGINDDEDILKELLRQLVKNRIRPYYLHQCDLINGAGHFRVPIARSLELLNRLRGHISGLCLPTLVVDIPGGHGKVPLVNNPVVAEDERFIYLQGFAGGVAPYPKD